MSWTIDTYLRMSLRQVIDMCACHCVKSFWLHVYASRCLLSMTCAHVIASSHTWICHHFSLNRWWQNHKEMTYLWRASERLCELTQHKTREINKQNSWNLVQAEQNGWNLGVRVYPLFHFFPQKKFLFVSSAFFLFLVFLYLFFSSWPVGHCLPAKKRIEQKKRGKRKKIRKKERTKYAKRSPKVLSCFSCMTVHLYIYIYIHIFRRTQM